MSAARRPPAIPVAYDPELDGRVAYTQPFAAVWRAAGWVALAFWFGSQVTATFILLPAAIDVMHFFRGPWRSEYMADRFAFFIFSAVSARVTVPSFICAFVLLLTSLRDAAGAESSPMLRYLPTALVTLSAMLLGLCYSLRMSMFAASLDTVIGLYHKYTIVCGVEVALLALAAFILSWLQTRNYATAPAEGTAS